MKTKIKRTLAVALALVMVVMSMPVGITASAAGTSMSNATKISFESTVNDSIAKENEMDWYKFVLSSSGTVTFKFTSFMQHYCAYIYNEDGVQVWYTDENEWVSTTGKRSDSYKLDLEKGTYYLKITGYRHGEYSPSTGNYFFDMKYVPSGANVAEPNNNIMQAKKIVLGNTIKGQIAINDPEDYYCFTMPESGTVNFNITSFMQYYCAYIYNEDGAEVWYTDRNEWVSTTGKRSDSYKLDLEKGTYYLKITGYLYRENSPSTGNYFFDMKYVPSGANVAEPNNNIMQAKKIVLGNTIKGQIAINDPEDYYCFTMPESGTVNFNITSFMQYYCAYIYNEDGAEVWYTDRNEWVSTTGKRSDSYKLDLEKGTYYLKITGYRYGEYSPSTGNYTFKISVAEAAHVWDSGKITKSPTCTENGVKKYTCKGCGSTKTQPIPALGHKNKVTLTKATTSKDGKQVTTCSVCKKTLKTVVIPKASSFKLSASSYAYDGKAKTPSVTVKDSKGKTLKNGTDYTLTYSKKGAKAIGKYTVKVTLKGNYSGTKTLTYYIKPGVTSKLSVKQTTNSITLTWNKVAGAQKYRVMVYNAKTKKWDKVADTTKLTYTVKKLKAGTAYKYAVKALYTKDKVNYWADKQKEVSTATKPLAPALTVKSGAKKATLSWKKLTGTGYEIYMTTSKNGKYKKLATIKNAKTVSYTAKNLKKGQTVYFKIRAYKTVGKTNVYSAYSAVKAVKIK